MGDPTARAATLADLPGMLEVIEAAFPTWPPMEVPASNAEHLRWKLGPGGDAAIGEHILVELDGRVVAVRLKWSGDAQVGSEQYTWEQSADMAVHPDFQGRGISRVLSELRDRGFKEHGTVGLGTRSHHAAVQHMDGPRRNQRPLTVWTRQRTARAFVAAHRRAGGVRQVASALGGVLRQRRVRGRAELEIARGSVAVLDRFDEATDALWAEARGEFEVGTHRLAERQNWRHLDARGGRTVVLALADDARCLGYAVFKPNGGVVNVVDVLAAPGRTAVVAALLDAGVHCLGAEGYTRFASWLPSGHAYEAGFRGAGFLETGQRAYGFANQLYDDGPPEAQRLLREPGTRFHITMSDFDYF